jgi:hypothetical protein
MALLVLGLLSAFVLKGIMPADADSCQCHDTLSHSDCRCHSVPCLAVVNAALIAALAIAPFHSFKTQLTPKNFACSILRPPPGLTAPTSFNRLILN